MPCQKKRTQYKRYDCKLDPIFYNYYMNNRFGLLYFSVKRMNFRLLTNAQTKKLIIKTTDYKRHIIFVSCSRVRDPTSPQETVQIRIQINLIIIYMNTNDGQPQHDNITS